MARVCLAIVFAFLAMGITGCGKDDSPNQPQDTPSNIPTALQDVMGDYDVTYDAEITAALTGAKPMALSASPATISLKASQPGVMAVPQGMVIPGIAPADIIFGAAYVQNPVHIFLGTRTANQHGDFGIWSSVWIGLPPGDVYLRYDGCVGTRFACSPVFFESTDIVDAVNLVYFTILANQNQDGSITFSGFLADTHVAEASAANGFSILVNHDILGQFVDQFIFDAGASFQLTVSGGAIIGSIEGVGRSLVGSDPSVATFRVTINGNKAR